jgi:hypothetical protein
LSPDEPVVRVDVREVRDVLRGAGLGGDAANGRFERAEAAAERDLLLVGEGLSAEEQDRVLLELGNDVAESGVVHAFDVDVHDLDAEPRVETPRRQ